jgi:predicted Rossmann-fold nucleotide-binding protein
MGAGENARAIDIRNAFALGSAIANEGWVVPTGGRNRGVMDAVNERRWSAGCSNHGDPVMNQLSYKPREPIRSTFRPAIFNRNVLTFDISDLLQAATEGSNHRLVPVSRRHIEKSD